MQVYNSKKAYLVIKMISVALVIIMAVLAVILYAKTGSVNLNAEGAFNVAECICGLMVSATLFVLTAVKRYVSNRGEEYFFITLLLFAFSLFFVEVTWLLQGRSDLIWAIYLNEILQMLTGTWMIYFFYRYILATVLRRHSEKLKWLTVLLLVIACIATLIAIINPITGWVFTVNAEGIEIDGPLRVLRDFLAIYPLFFIAIVVVFITVYDSNRREYESKMRDIEIADAVLEGVLPKEGEDISLTPAMQALVNAHTIPDAMKLTEMLTAERVRIIGEKESNK